MDNCLLNVVGCFCLTIALALVALWPGKFGHCYGPGRSDSQNMKWKGCTFVYINSFGSLGCLQGPAVWALRAQTDKIEYSQEMRRLLEQTPNLDIREGEARYACFARQGEPCFAC